VEVTIFWQAQLAWAVINMSPFLVVVLIALVPTVGMSVAILVNLAIRAVDARKERLRQAAKKSLHPWRHPWHSRETGRGGPGRSPIRI
jgi:hypothetical protein